MQCQSSAPPADLFFLRGERALELTAQCGALVSSVIDHRSPVPAVSIWRPRPRVIWAPPLSIQLRLFNQTFLDLCDAVSFADNSVPSVFPAAPVFLKQETAWASRVSWELFLCTLDRLHSGETTSLSHGFVHISLLGRRRSVWMEVYAFSERNALTEIVMVETILSDDTLLADLLWSGPCSLLQPQGSVPGKDAGCDVKCEQKEQLQRRPPPCAFHAETFAVPTAARAKRYSQQGEDQADQILCATAAACGERSRNSGRAKRPACLARLPQVWPKQQ